MPASELDFRLAPVPRPALILGVAGLLPFVLLAALSVLTDVPLADRARFLLGAWGCAILAFLGGARWGFAAAGLGEGVSVWTLAVGAAPPALAAIALGAGGRPMLWICALGIVASFAADVSLARALGAPAWWPALRLPLTIVAAASLVIGALS